MVDSPRRSPRLAGLGTALLVALVAGNSPARAEHPPAPDPARTGFHLSLGGVYAFENLDETIGSLDVEEAYAPGSAGRDPGFDDSAGIDLRLGYRPHARFDLALFYEWLEGFDSTRTQPPLEIDTHLITLDGRVFLLTGRTQPYALLGLGALVANTEIVDGAFDKPFDTNAGFAARLGGGVDFYLSPHWLVELEGAYVVPTGAVRRNEYGTLGFKLGYRF